MLDNLVQHDLLTKKPFLCRLKLSPNIRRKLYYLNPKTFSQFIYKQKFCEKFKKEHNKDYYMETLRNRCSKEEIDFVQLIKDDKEKFCSWLQDKINTLLFHDELKAYTPKLNIEYKTNFSHLKTDLK